MVTTIVTPIRDIRIGMSGMANLRDQSKLYPYPAFVTIIDIIYTVRCGDQTFEEVSSQNVAKIIGTTCWFIEKTFSYTGEIEQRRLKVIVDNNIFKISEKKLFGLR